VETDMTKSIVPPLSKSSIVVEKQDQHFGQCLLEWRCGQLLVKSSLQHAKPKYLPAPENQQHLVDCLKCSPVKLVRIDPRVGEAKLLLWADACEQANKVSYVRVPAACSQTDSPMIKWFKRLVNAIAACLLLVVFSPFMIFLIIYTRLNSEEPLFCREWHLGERGKLFRTFTFRPAKANLNLRQEQTTAYVEWTDDVKSTLLTKWIYKSGANSLPQLLNVVRGEMSLFGPRCLDLKNIVGCSHIELKRSNMLPGIAGSWQVETSNLLDLDSPGL